MNIGVRHLLPIYPLVIIWASQAIQWPTQRGVVSVAKVVMLTGLTAWYVLNTLGSHPHYVTYFNELIGGPRNGYQYLSDSNVDMGQDLKRVSAYLREAGITEPHVLCLGETNLWGCHGVAYHMPHAKLWGAEYPRALPAELPAGFFVIGKTPRWLAREKLKKNAAALQQWKALAKLLDNVAPVHTIGHSVDIYYLTPHKTLLSNQPQTHSRRIE
jgi:hypothetical protein